MGIPASPEASERDQLLAPPPSQRSMTRSESITQFVRDVFETVRNPKEKVREALCEPGNLKTWLHQESAKRFYYFQRRSVYSRHLMDVSLPSPRTSEVAEQVDYLNKLYSTNASSNFLKLKDSRNPDYSINSSE